MRDERLDRFTYIIIPEALKALFVTDEADPLSEQLVEAKRRISDLTDRNDRLTQALREAGDQLLQLKEEVDRLSEPPSGYGIFLEALDDGTVDIFTGGRTLRVAVSPEVNVAGLKGGDEVMLNEAMNVIETRTFARAAEVVLLKEILDTGDRALIIEHNGEERVVYLAETLKGQQMRVGDSLVIDNRSGIAYERLPTSDVSDFLLEEIPSVTYSDIGGISSQVEQIRDAVELPYLHPDLFRRLGVSPPKGVLLYGPPGCGKTLIAKAVANSLAQQVHAVHGGDARATAFFLNIKGPELLNKYVGETERLIRLVFQRARDKASEGAPVIVFFDEMDALFRARGSGVSSDVENTIVPQLLTEIDGVESLENVIVIGASNREDMIDPAILRPGRLDVTIKIDRPNPDGAREILEKYLTLDLPYDIDSRDTNLARTHRDRLIARVIEFIYTDPTAELRFVEVTFESGQQEKIGFSRFLSGALLHEVVDRAKRRSMKRSLVDGALILREADLLESVRDVVRRTKDLLNTTRFDDWAWISGARGENIRFIRTLSGDGAPDRAVDIGRIKWGNL